MEYCRCDARRSTADCGEHSHSGFSGQEASQQATARYQAGLGTIVEVAEAQRLLTQAQIDDALSRLSVWRAELAVTAADGDIQPFLTGASQ